MSQQQNITVKDSDFTTTLTFIPQSGTAGQFLWRTAKSGVPYIGQSTIAMKLNDDAKLPTRQVKLSINIPSMEVISGTTSAGYVAAPKRAFADKVDVIFTLDKRSANASFIRALLHQVLHYVDLGTAVGNATRVNIVEAIDSGIHPV